MAAPPQRLWTVLGLPEEQQTNRAPDAATSSAAIKSKALPVSSGGAV
jgi:hypothetical protein